MSHYNRRYLPIQAQPKQTSLNRSLPFRNNETRLKQIYQGQQVFKERPKETTFRKNVVKHQLPLTLKKSEREVLEVKHKSHHIQNLNLAEIKVSNRYRQRQKQQEARGMSLYQNYDIDRQRSHHFRENIALTSRNKDESVLQKSQIFKIKRTSISGSLKKKIKEQAIHHLSSVNPTLLTQVNYYQEGRKAYKQGKISEALKLFELAIEKNIQAAESHYYSALCYLNKHMYQRGYDLLTTIIQKFTTFGKKTVYLFAGISAKNLNLIDRAIELISLGLQKYPDYLDLYLYRAKLYQSQQNYEKAHEDYEIVLKQRKENVQILFNDAMCLKKLGAMANCLAALSLALYNDQKGQFKSKILLQRLKINFQAKKIKDCKKDIQKIEERQVQLGEVCYYKGLIQLIENNKKEALLSFQKCIRLDNCKKAVTGSLIEITKSKIDDRDFYSAFYHISRASFLQVSSVQIQKFKLFTEGVVFMMKRKINEGVSNFYKLQKDYNPLGSYFEKLFYLYRGFGHFMQNKHELSIADYEMVGRYSVKDKHVRYNQLIAQGIVLVQKQMFDQALQKFDMAQKIISAGAPTLKIQPFIYRAMTFVEKIKSSNRRQPSKADQLQVLEQIFIALKELDKAYDVNDSNSNMLYLRSLIYLYLQKSEDGLQDIVKAISKSQQNVAKYFFYRALAHETMGNKKQAWNDFNICINLDEKQPTPYLERAKLLFSNDQTSKALQDLKKLKQLSPEMDCKLHECCLFYLIAEYQLAQGCLPFIENEQKKLQMQIMINLKQLRVTDAKNLMRAAGDRMICQIMLSRYDTAEAAIEDLQYFNRVEYYSYLGIKKYHMGQFEEAINNFDLALKQKSLMDLQQNVIVSSEEEGAEDEEAEDVIDNETKANQLHYLNYNLFVCLLANGDRKKAYETFIRDVLPAKEHFLRSDKVGALSRLLFQTMKAKQDEVVTDSAPERQIFECALFRSLIGQSEDYIDIELPNFILRTKLCYLMPFAKNVFKEYSPKISPAFILQNLKISEVQNRPEPPWVKRNNQDLCFTDDIIDINVEFQTTEHDEQNEEEYDGEEGEEGEADEEQEESEEKEATEHQETAFDPRKFRDQMKLDDSIEKKLQRIMEKKKKTE